MGVYSHDMGEQWGQIDLGLSATGSAWKPFGDEQTRCFFDFPGIY